MYSVANFWMTLHTGSDFEADMKKECPGRVLEAPGCSNQLQETNRELEKTIWSCKYHKGH